MTADTYVASDWTASGRAWKALFAAIDARDAQRFAALLTPSAVFRFGNSPPVRGRAAIVAAVGGFFDSIAGCHHELSRSWSGEGSVACEGAVTYTRHDRRQVTVPFANTFTLDGGQINCYRIYIDNAALYAP